MPRNDSPLQDNERSFLTHRPLLLGAYECAEGVGLSLQLCLLLVGEDELAFGPGFEAEMGGCDLLLFTGGIGENAWFMRHPILEGLECLGIKVDMELNDKTMGEDVIISTPDSKVATVVVTTDEEFVIASDTYRLVTGK